MPLNVTLIDLINNGTIGSDGLPPRSFGAAGKDGGAASELVSGDSFSDPVAALTLAPFATGGSASAGELGTGGVNSTAIGIFPNGSYGPGTNGGPGGAGGAFGNANVSFENDVIGSNPAPYGGPVTISVNATGGDFAVAPPGGGEGGIGGSGGLNEHYTSASEDGYVTGSTPGVAGSGGDGGQGGSATAILNTVSDTSTSTFTITVDAAAGTGSLGGDGGLGSSGGAFAAGADGGPGGDGGDAEAAISNGVFADDYAISLSEIATGGSGANGGAGGDAGYSSTGIEDLLTNVISDAIQYGVNGNGGNGGNAGSATDILTGNTVAAAAVSLDFATNAGLAGNGGTGASEPSIFQIEPSGTINQMAGQAGLNGASGLNAFGTIEIENNVISATTNPLSSLLESFLSLSLSELDTNAEPITLNGGSGGDLVFSANSFIGDGASTLSLSVPGGGVTIDTATNQLSIDGSSGNVLTGFSTFDLDENETFIAGDGTYSVHVSSDPDTLVFEPGFGQVSIFGSSAATPVLEFSGFGSALDNLTELESDTTVGTSVTSISTPGGGVINFLGGVQPDLITPDVNFGVSCFAEGTSVKTPNGDVPIQALAAGDRVIVLSGEAAAIVWVGHRRVDCGRHPRPTMVMPIRIIAHAFGMGRPTRDLLLSPDHSIFVEDVLIPIKYLENGATVRQEQVAEVTYYHLELNRHDVLFADGLPAETYFDLDSRRAFTNANGTMQFHPDLGQRPGHNALIWDALGYAKVVVVGDKIRRVREMLDRQAQTLRSRSRQVAQVTF